MALRNHIFCVGGSKEQNIAIFEIATLFTVTFFNNNNDVSLSGSTSSSTLPLVENLCNGQFAIAIPGVIIVGKKIYGVIPQQNFYNRSSSMACS